MKLTKRLSLKEIPIHNLNFISDNIFGAIKEKILVQQGWLFKESRP